MKKLVLCAMLLFGFSVMAMAQETPAFEIFGGYSYVRCDDSSWSSADCNLSGWDASLAANGNKWLGVVADVSGQYGSVSGAGVKLYSAMFGPRLTFRAKKFTPFIQGLFGAAHADIADGLEKDNMFAMAFGGGVDITIKGIFAVRPAQVEYFATRNGSDILSHTRFSAGIVFKLGKRK